jgi:hypothetical protein
MRFAVRSLFLGFLMLLAAVIAAADVAIPAAPHPNTRAWLADTTAILLTDDQPQTIDHVRTAIEAVDGHLVLYVPPGVLIAQVPDDGLAALRLNAKIRKISKRPFSAAGEGITDRNATLAVNYFNWVASGQADVDLDATAGAAPIGMPPSGDVVMKTPAVGRGKTSGALTTALNAPLTDHPYLGTSVLVNVIFVEGPGSTWSDADQGTAFNAAATAMSWWNSRLVAHFGVVRPVTPQFYTIESHRYSESVTPGDSDTAGQWVNPIMNAACIDNPQQSCTWFDSAAKDSSDYYTQVEKNVRAYNQFTGAARHMNDAFTAFLINKPVSISGGDVGGYAIELGGAWWTVGNEATDVSGAATMAHETGHIYWACDEYGGSPASRFTGCLTCGGPRNVLNGNADSRTGSNAGCAIPDRKHEKCLMKAPYDAFQIFSNDLDSEYDKVCPYTEEQIGWTDPTCWTDVNWNFSSAGPTHWEGQYFSDSHAPRMPLVHWAGAPELTRDDGGANFLSFNFTGGDPLTSACLTGGSGARTTDFSVRWRRKIVFEDGDYEFHGTGDDSVQIYVDNFELKPSATTGVFERIKLTAGEHTVLVDYFQTSGSANLSVSWTKLATPVSCPAPAYIASLASPTDTDYCSGEQPTLLISATAGTPPYRAAVQRNNDLAITYPMSFRNFIIRPQAIGGDSAYKLLSIVDANGCPGNAIDQPTTINIDSITPRLKGGFFISGSTGCSYQMQWGGARSCASAPIVYTLTRAAISGGTTVTTTPLPCTTVQSYTDNDIHPGVDYVYTLTAIEIGPGQTCATGAKRSYPQINFHVNSCPSTPASIATSSVTANYGDHPLLSAHLTGNGAPITNRSVVFDINGVSAGSGTTDVNGDASAMATVTLNAGSYPGALAARFLGDDSWQGATATADVTVLGNCIPASITTQPTGSTIAAGGSATLSVSATGTAPLTVQWYTAAGNPVGSGSSITVWPSWTTAYYAIVSNACLSLQSAPATVAVVVAQPAAITWPTPADIVYGTPLGNNQLNATASVPGTFTYDPPAGTILQSGDGQTLRVTFVPTDNVSYATTSAATAINVHKAPQTITWTPPASVGYGTPLSSVQLNATISVPGPDPASPLVYSPLAGTVLPVGTFALSVTADGTANYNAASASVAFTVLSCMPQITAQPQDGIVNNGTPVVLSVTATNAASYQWFQGDTGDVSQPLGTTASISVTPSADAKYWVRLHGSCSMWVDSRVASVRVCIPPSIGTSPLYRAITAYQTTTIGFNLFAGTDTVLHWYAGAAGNTSSPLSYTTPNISVAPLVTTQYWARVSNTCGSVDTPTITVDVCSAPVITTDLADVTILSGGTTTLSVAATITPGAVYYQWFNGAAGDTSVSVGTNAPSYTTGVLQADAQYWVRITRGNCATDSRVATVTACSLSVSAAGALSHSGQLVPLTANVYGARAGGAMTYTWYRGTAPNTSVPIASGPYYQTFQVAPLTTTSYWVRVSDGTCTADSNTTTVSTCGPTIVTQPSSAVINAGTSATLSVTATGDNLTYQWYQGSGYSSPVGTNSPTLTVSPAATTSYRVLVNGCGYVESQPATLTVCQPATATTSYTTYPIVYGQSAAIYVNVSGNPAPSLQWYQGVSGDTSTPLAGRTTNSITVAPYATTAYWCRASNQCATANGPTITVDVCSAPVINTQPADRAIPTNGITTLSVNVSTTPGAVLYQWYRGAAGDYSAPVGTSPTYTTPALTADTQYWVHITRGACATDSTAATVSVCTLWAGVANAQSKSSQAVTLAAGVSNARTTPTYLWYRGNAGDTSSLISYASSIVVAPATTTNYWVRVSDGICTTDSNTATVSTCIPNIVTHPSNTLINSGQSATLGVTATGDGLSYQWYVGASGVTTTPIGGNSSTLTVSPSIATTYWVRVTGCQVAYSNAATVTVCAPPVITGQPLSPNVVRNGSATVSVNATGTNLSYQWYLGNSGVTTTPVGTNSTTYTSSYAQTTNVWVRVTGACGSVNSTTATVSVYPGIYSQPVDTRVTSGTGATFTVSVDSSPVTYQWYQGTSGDTSHPVSGATGATFTSAPLTVATSFFVRVTSGNAQTFSATATASICVGPTVNVWNPYQASGATATLTIADPSGSDTYKWYKGNSGDTSVLVADSGSGTSITVYPTQTTSYWARATNAQCSGDSAAVSVYVCTPAVTIQPNDASITQGQTTRLSVAANGTPPLTYQWYRGDFNSATAITGATGTYVDVTPSSTTTYYVRVSTNQWCAVNSRVATVNVCQLPVITAVSGGGASTRGYTTGLSVTASGTNLNYQWYSGQSGDTSYPILTNTPTPTFTAWQSAYYWVRVTNSCGGVNSATVLNSVSPQIYYPPQNVTISSGSSTTLSVYASGTYLTYQWYLNDFGHPIAGATGPNYTTPAVTADTTYWVAVTSGVATSYAYATVSLCVGPVIDYSYSQWLGNNAWYAIVQVNEQDRNNVSYYWYKGQTGDTSQPIGWGNYYMYVNPTVTTSYWCRVWFADNSCSSDSAAITVH